MTEAVGGECALSPSRQTEAHIYVASGGGLSSFLQLMSADAGCVRQDREEDRASSALQEEKVDIRHEGEGAEMGGKFKVARSNETDGIFMNVIALNRLYM